MKARVRWLEDRLDTLLEKIQIKETNIVTHILKVENDSKKKQVELQSPHNQTRCVFTMF